MQHQQRRAHAPMRSAAPDWSKLLSGAGPAARRGPSQGGASTPTNLEQGDADASRPASRASSSYFLGAASGRSSTASLNRLGEQPAWQSSDIEEFLKRRSTDADSGDSHDFERWAATSRAHTSYQLPLFTLPANSKALAPRPSSSFEHGALQQKEEVLGQLRALQQAAAQLLSEGGQDQPAGEQQEEKEEQEPAAGEALRQAGASAAGAAKQPEASQAAVPAPPPAAAGAAAAAAAATAALPASPRPGSATPLPAAASPAPLSPFFATPGSRLGHAGGARSAAAVPRRPASSPAYGCITTPSSAVVARQAASSSAAGAKAASSLAPASPGVGSITDHLQQLKLLQQQAQKLFG
jgi:hypothetical protein